MSTQFDINKYFDTMKACLDLPVEKEWEVSVKFHIQNAKQMADICNETDINENSLELSNTFNPGAS